MHVGFNFGSVFSCYFGTEAVLGVFLSSTEIQCNIPYRPIDSISDLSGSDRNASNASKSVSFTVSMNGINAISTFTYLYMDVPEIISINVYAGPLEGGGIVSVVMNPGMESVSDANQTVSCMFGTVSSVGYLVSSTTINCIVPPAISVGVVLLSVALNGLVINSPFLYRYQASSSIVAVVPSYGSTAGGTVVVVYGVSFESSVSASCMFGDVSVIALVVNSTAIECETPLAVPAPVPFSLILDGYNIPSRTIFTYR